MVTTTVVNGLLVQPKYLWPLSGETFKFEVQNGGNVQSPANGECLAVGPGHPTLSYNAMYFDRAANSHVDITIPSQTINDVGFSAFFYSMDEDGVVFHYKSDNQDPADYLSELIVKVKGGSLKAEIDSRALDIGRLKMPTNLPYNIPVNEWTMVTFTNSYNPGVTRLYINTFVEPYSHPFILRLRTPGKLRFGAELTSTGLVSPFKGFITCAALYTVATGFGNQQDLLQHCSKTNWPNPAPTPPCQIWFEETTTASVSTELPEHKPAIIYIWSMDDASTEYNVFTMDNTSNVDCPRYGKPHPEFPHNSVHFDGSVMSGLQTTIAFNELIGSFTLAGYIVPRSSTSGVVFQLIMESSLTSLFRVDIIGADLLFKSFDPFGGACSSVLLSGVITADQWQLLAIEKNNVANNWTILLDSARYAANSICGDWTMSNFKVVVSIGTTATEVVGFYGDIRWLILFDGVFDEEVDEEIKDVCFGNNTLGSNLKCSSTKTGSRYHIRLKTGYKVPDEIQAIETMISKSLTYCAVQCYFSAYCRSFSWNQNGGCLLYDFVTLRGLIISTETDYYAVRN
ncbi:hypothetical protein SNE40_006488 [Patella caerulea]|uniref:Apple domain-containing protein n=1 Tax=Patella caerulea TaxID=87958 RepID=A0AAN8K093_PATCE